MAGGANTPTLNYLKNVFELFFSTNQFLNGFDFGGPDWNLDVSGDTKFPYMYVETSNSRWAQSPDSKSFLTEEQTFKIYVIDRVNKGDSNYIDSFSDCKYVLETFISQFNQHQFSRDLGINLTDNINFEPLFEFSKDNCNGWVATLTLRYPMRFSPCNNPYIGPLAYTYSLGTFTSEVRLVGPQGATGPTGPPGSYIYYTENYGTSQSQIAAPNGLIISGTSAQYDTDYSLNYTNRSLVDKEYVDTLTYNIVNYTQIYKITSLRI